MKHFVHISFLFFITLFSYGQNLPVSQEKAPGIYLSDGTKVNEYKKTFEIKDIPNPDNITLSKIDMSKYWKFIDTNNRVEVLDDVTDLTLILYSRSEANAIIDFNSVLIVLRPEPAGDEKKKTQ